MNIKWHGQACFRIESKEATLLIDPFPREIGLKPPKLDADIILVTHGHYDHSAIDGAPKETFVIKEPGEFEKSGITIQGLLSFHDNDNGSQRGYNTIYIITLEDMRICHLGDLGQHSLTQEQISEIGNIDILFIPVGGNYTINGSQAVKIIQEIEPKIIIPMHYMVDGLQIDLDGPEKFLKEIGMTPEIVDSYKIVKKNLPVEEMKLVQFSL